MSCSKPLPPFTFDLLCYLNRNQLERFSIVCRPMKNLIERYFHSKPYRVFEELHIRGGSYRLKHKYVQWHPNQDDYSAQQFLAGQRHANFGIASLWERYYSFAEMCPYLGPTVRINWTFIDVAGGSIYNPEHVEEMESIAYLWRDGNVYIWHASDLDGPIVAEDFQLILYSPTILQCRILDIDNAQFSFKDYKVLYTLKVIATDYKNEELDTNYWLKFLEQPGAKPVVFFGQLQREIIDNVLEQLSKDFSSAVLPNAFKIVFGQLEEPLSEFRENEQRFGRDLELKKGIPVECHNESCHPAEYQEENRTTEEYNCYTLERSSI